MGKVSTSLIYGFLALYSLLFPRVFVAFKKMWLKKKKKKRIHHVFIVVSTFRVIPSHVDFQIFKTAVLCQILTMFHFSLTSYSATKKKKFSDLIKISCNYTMLLWIISLFLVTQSQTISNFSYIGNITNMTFYYSHIPGVRAWKFIHFGILPTKMSIFKISQNIHEFTL